MIMLTTVDYNYAGISSSVDSKKLQTIFSASLK
jgi:hypothetical protein